MNQNFSAREGISSTPVAITMRYGEPKGLRVYLCDTLLERLGLEPTETLSIIAGILRVSTQGNWSTQNIKDEVRSLLADTNNCPWNKLYDIIERFYAKLRGDQAKRHQFEEEINGYFYTHGIGWILENGLVISRGDDTFEQSYREVIEESSNRGLSVTADHLKEARTDLSRRPAPDINGAVTHAYQAIECLSREVVGSKKETLGELLKKHPDLFPSPLNQALAQVWGFVSNTVRHPREGEGISIEEVELLVGIIPPLAKYLLHKFPEKEDDPLPF